MSMSISNGFGLYDDEVLATGLAAVEVHATGFGLLFEASNMVIQSSSSCESRLCFLRSNCLRSALQNIEIDEFKVIFKTEKSMIPAVNSNILTLDKCLGYKLNRVSSILRTLH